MTRQTCLMLLAFTLGGGVISTDFQKNDPAPLMFPGQVNIGMLIDLHKNEKFRSGTRRCGEINGASVKKLMAAVWTVQMLNANKDPNDFTVGIHAYDTCGSDQLSVRQAVRLVNQASREQKCDHYHKSQIITGVINTANKIETTFDIFNDFSVPSIVTSDSKPVNNAKKRIQSTTASKKELAYTTYQLFGHLGIENVTILSGNNQNDHHLKTLFLQKSVQSKKMRVSIENSKESLLDHLSKFGNNTVILFMDPSEALTILNETKAAEDNDTRWLIVSSSPVTRKNISKTVQKLPKKVIWIQPNVPTLSSFHKYFNRMIQDTRRKKLPFISKYLNSVETPKIDRQDDAEILPIIYSMVAYFGALQSVSRSSCKERHQKCSKYLENRWLEEVKEALTKLDYTIESKSIPEIMGVKLKFGVEDGALKNMKFDIFTCGSNGKQVIGHFSEKTELKILKLELLKNWLNWTKESKSYKTSKPISNNLLPPSFIEFEINSTEAAGVHKVSPDVKLITERPIRLSDWIKRPSVWVTLMLSAIGLLSSLYILVFVSVKLCDGTLTGNQSLGLLQLIAVMGLFVSAILFVVVRPTPTLCSSRQVLASVCYAVTFAVMIVKLMQLHSLVNIGLGGRVNQMNQFLTLFFIVAVQVVLSVQQIILMPSKVVENPNSFPTCFVEPDEVTFSQSYLIVLSLIAFFLSISVRHIHRNYNEGHCLLLTTGLSLPVWIIWISLYYNIKDTHYRDMTVAMVNIITGTIILAIIFGPKLFTINKQSDSFKQKALSSYAGSMSTLFSNLNDFETLSAGTMSIKSGSITSNSTRHYNYTGKGSSASMKKPKTFPVINDYNDSKTDDDPIITFNPLYEQMRTFK